MEVDHDPEGTIGAVQHESDARETAGAVTVGRVLIEACVESLDESLAAERGGADRLELCANMYVGGTTPSAELFTTVRATIALPIAMMVRPRGGTFVYSREELASMRDDVDRARDLGADVIVLGVLDRAGSVDAKHTRELVARAGETPVTFHKAFDEIDDQLRALDVLTDCGVTRVLTSGGQPAAIDGAGQLARLVDHADGRISIMAGGKVRGANARELVARTAVKEVHARCNTDPFRIADIAAALR
jgi:copper homeostasis protein